MNEMKLVLQELKQTQDQNQQILDNIASLLFEVAIMKKKLFEAFPSKQMSSIFQHTPDDDYLDKLEAEEHAKTLCTVPGVNSVTGE